MSATHWTEQDFIDHAYGVGPAGGHLEACAECRARSGEFAAARKRMAREPEISAEFLAGQRRAIYRQLGRGPRAGARAAPAFAVALVLLLALLVARPGPQAPAPLVTSAADSQLLADIYALEQSSEPRAARTIQALFEDR